MADKKQTKLNAVEELRKLDAKALEQKVAELKKQLVEQHRAHAAQELPNPGVIGKTRKEIAQTLTIMAETKARPATSKEENK